MYKGLRILAAGEIQTSHRLRFISASEPLLWAEHSASDLVQLALEQGAVHFALDMNYDPYVEYHSEDEPFELLGSKIATYKEYWELYPEEREEQPEPDWQMRILLRVSGPILRLIGPGTEYQLLANPAAEFGLADAAYIIALVPESSSLGPEVALNPEIPLIQPGSLRPLATDSWEWQLGEYTLQQGEYPPHTQRDWAWAWATTIGPVYLNIHLDRSANEIQTWLNSAVCYEYRLIGQRLVPSNKQISITDGYPEVQADGYAIPSERYIQGVLRYSNGLLSFIRSFHSPRAPQQSVDASLLAALQSGDLGELSWDLFDGDYVYFEATGKGIDSLYEYLDPASDKQMLEERWKHSFTRYEIDASAAEDWAQVAHRIAKHFQLAAEGNPIEDLEHWLAHTPITMLPRRVQVSIRQSLYEKEQEPLNQLIAANGRIIWSWQLIL